MKNMKIFEPAMCCETGLCGVGVDPELLRISTVLHTLKSKGVTVSRYNLSSAPMEFINNKVINAYINAYGPESLPITTLDDKIIITSRYPTNEEFINLLNLPEGMLEVTQKKSGGCGCKGGCC